ncbi:CRISPR-associated endonuclease Cas2 [Candidatus Uhrbacteria bacterium]|nr:CRISPR-associated endonuclease Cas2 [Candidatus Uhrbacteria bacterium]
MEKRFGNKKRLILLGLIVLGTIPVAGAVTGVLGLWAAYELKADQIRWKRAFYELERDKFIRRRGRASSVYFEMAPRGSAISQQIITRSLAIKEQYEWDQKLRIVSFDISIERSSTRQRLRKILLSLGFVKLQQSIYAHKYPCTQQVNHIQKHLACKNNILFFESSNPDLLTRYQQAVTAKTQVGLKT